MYMHTPQVLNSSLLMFGRWTSSNKMHGARSPVMAAVQNSRPARGSACPFRGRGGPGFTGTGGTREFVPGPQSSKSPACGDRPFVAARRPEWTHYPRQEGHSPASKRVRPAGTALCSSHAHLMHARHRRRRLFVDPCHVPRHAITRERQNDPPLLQDNPPDNPPPPASTRHRLRGSITTRLDARG